MSPVLGTVILVVVTVLLAASITPFVLESLSVEEGPTGVDVSFSESSNGSVEVTVLNMGTADNVTVQTEYLKRNITEPGTRIMVYPGEGRITVIATKNGIKRVTQQYKASTGPDSPLAAITTGNTQKAPGETYNLSGSDSLGNITEYRWDIDGDGITDKRGESISVNWTRPGIYRVTLTVETDDGNTHSSNIRITNTHLIVSKDGTGDYKNIEPAINNSSSSWSIYVKDTGQYEEEFEIDKPNLTIFSDEFATVNGKFTNKPYSGIQITGNGIELRGLRVRGFVDGSGITIDSSTKNVDLVNVYVDENGNSSTFGGAVHVERGAVNVDITDTRILSSLGNCGLRIGEQGPGPDGPSVNIADSAIRSTNGEGICAYDSLTKLSINNTNFIFNDKHGLVLNKGENVTITNSSFRQNGVNTSTSDSALVLRSTTDAHLNGLRFKNNFDSGVTTELTNINLSIQNSQVISNEGDGIRLNNTHNATVKNIQSNSNKRGLAVIGDSYRVNVNDSVISGNNRTGIVFSKYVNNSQVISTDVRKNTEHGVMIDRSNSIYLEDVNLTDNGGDSGNHHGLYVEGNNTTDPENITVRFSHLYGTNQSEEDVFIGSNANSVVDVEENWWGTNAGPSESNYSGNISYKPHCENPNCSSLRPIADIQSGDTYVIKNVNSGKVIDVEGGSTTNGTDIQQYEYLGRDAQEWTLNELDNGYYKFEAVHSGKVMEVKGVNNTSNNTNIQQYEYLGGESQQWNIIKNYDGSYRIIAHHSGKAASVYLGGTTNGTSIIQYAYEADDSQKWKFTNP